MKYAVMTSTGFQMRGSEAAVYNSIEEAMAAAGPGDSFIMVTDPEDVVATLEDYFKDGK